MYESKPLAGVDQIHQARAGGLGAVLDGGVQPSLREYGALVPCDSQEEIDYFWQQLPADPEAGQCGWLNDRYGVSWQITPSVMGELLGGKDRARAARVTQAFLKMKKFDIAALERAAAG